MPIRRFISLLSALVLSILPLAAQKLPSLGTAGEISKGTLPDGVAYYLVKNAAVDAAVEAFLCDFEKLAGPGKTMLDC